MIRFSCPGCAATYSVDDSKGGKTGKCPKCASQFQIPMPEAGGSSAPEPATFPSAPPPPPPLSTPGDVSGNSTVEIDPCPGCQARLSVSGSDIGIDVECPYCKTVYKAVKAGSRPPAPPPAPPKTSDLEDDGGSYKPRKSSRKDDDDDDDRPSKRRSKRDDDDDDRPSKRRSRRDDDDDDDDDRPSRRRKRRGSRSMEPHRGGMILTFAILGWAVCVIFGIVAWAMGAQDIKKMDAGQMDDEGRGLTQAGKIIAMIQCIFSAGILLLYCVLAIVGGAGGGGK